MFFQKFDWNWFGQESKKSDFEKRYWHWLNVYLEESNLHETTSCAFKSMAKTKLIEYANHQIPHFLRTNFPLLYDFFITKLDNALWEKLLNRNLFYKKNN